jgi:nitroreductase
VDIESLVCNGKARPITNPSSDNLGPEAPAEPQVPARIEDDRPLTAEEARFLISYAVLAPSGGNQQPWRFEVEGNRCLAFLDVRRAGSFLDYEYCASILSIGAATENICHAAETLGLRTRVECFPDSSQPLLIAVIDFERSGILRDPSTLKVMRDRVTNRRHGDRRELRKDAIRALMAASAAAGLNLQLATEDTALLHLARLLGKCDRLRFLSRTMHQDLMSELRWPGSTTLSLRTGIDLASLELSPADEAAMRVLSRWSAMARVKSFDGGRALELPARKLLTASSAVGLLSVEGMGPRAYFGGGRGVQSVWLEATRQSIAFQPYSSLIYLLARLEGGGGVGLDDQERRGLRELRIEFSSIFPQRAQHTELLLFRLGYAEQPGTRALRLPIEEVLTIRRAPAA